MKAAFVREPPQVSAADMKNKLQPGVSGPGELGRLGRGGHLQPTALHEPHTEFTMSVLSLTPGFYHNPPPGLPLPVQPQATCSPGVTP